MLDFPDLHSPDPLRLDLAYVRLLEELLGPEWVERWLTERGDRLALRGLYIKLAAHGPAAGIFGVGCMASERTTAKSLSVLRPGARRGALSLHESRPPETGRHPAGPSWAQLLGSEHAHHDHESTREQSPHQ
jgi:hypothetical protein